MKKVSVGQKYFNIVTGGRVKVCGTMGGLNMTDSMNEKVQPLVIISLALHFSILLYVAIVFFYGDKIDWLESTHQFFITGQSWSSDWIIREDKKILFNVLLIVSMATGFLSLLFPRFAPKPQGETSSPISPSENASLFFDFKKEDKQITNLTVVRMALAEVIAIYGLVLSILNQSRMVIVPFAAVALILQFLVGPIYGKLRAG